MNNDEQVTYFGETDARNKRVRFGIKKKDRSRHMYVIGKTGMGKSTLLENLAVQDIQNGEGLAFIDPHGKTADLLLEYVPEHRIKDVIYFAPFDLDHPISFNVLEDVGAERRHLVANGLMTAFKKIWVDAWSARMEYILTNIILALLEYPGSTLMGVNRMLVDKEFRKTIVDNISDPSVKAFWTEEYAKYTDKFAAEAAPAIQNKVGQFVANPLVRNIIGQSTSSFDIRKVMDEKKILIINLSKGRVGEANANLLGAMIITKIYLAAMSRADLNEDDLKKSPQFYLYVDEFQSFANESFADILSEARKYKLNLTIAHQYIEQMTEEVRAAVFGNVGTMVAFRVGAYDGAVFEKEFAPQFTAEDMVNLQQFQMYLKLMIDGVTSTPFSAMGMPPIPRPPQTFVQDIIQASRAQFAKPRAEVEDTIRNWHIEKIQPVGPDGKVLEKPSREYSPSREGDASGSPRNASQSGGYPSQGSHSSSSSYSDRSAGDRSSHDRSYNDRSQGDKSRERSSDQRAPSRGGDRPFTDGGSRSGDRSFAESGSRGSGADRERMGEKPRDRAEYRELAGDINAPTAPKRAPDAQASSPMSSSSLHAPGATQHAPSSYIPAHPSSTRDRAHTDRYEKDKKESYNRDREKSLRDAISLNYLKDKKEEEQKNKNIEKVAKPENVLALKEALLGLLNESVAEKQASNTQTQIDTPTARVNTSTRVDVPIEQATPQRREQVMSHGPQSSAVSQMSATPHAAATAHVSTDPHVSHSRQHAPSAQTHSPQTPKNDMAAGDDGFVDLRSFNPVSHAEPKHTDARSHSKRDAQTGSASESTSTSFSHIHTPKEPADTTLKEIDTETLQSILGK